VVGGERFDRMAGCRPQPPGLHRVGSLSTAFATDHAVLRGATDEELYVELDGCVVLYREYYTG
jgi:hypothetical protein